MLLASEQNNRRTGSWKTRVRSQFSLIYISTEHSNQTRLLSQIGVRSQFSLIYISTEHSNQTRLLQHRQCEAGPIAPVAFAAGSSALCGS